MIEGAANDVASVSAGAAAVAVAPIFIAVGSTDIAGTTGDTYVPPVDESPDPPATFCGLGMSGWVTTCRPAAMIALQPTPAANNVIRCLRIGYLQRKYAIRFYVGERSHSIGWTTV